MGVPSAILSGEYLSGKAGEQHAGLCKATVRHSCSRTRSANRPEWPRNIRAYFWASAIGANESRISSQPAVASAIAAHSHRLLRQDERQRHRAEPQCTPPALGARNPALTTSQILSCCPAWVAAELIRCGSDRQLPPPLPLWCSRSKQALCHIDGLSAEQLRKSLDGIPSSLQGAQALPAPTPFLFT
eukprot:6214444-Pleurochrysis_carterae.AAC.3